MGSTSSSRSLTLRLTFSQSRMSTPPSLSRYRRRYHCPASRTYSTSHSSQPYSAATGAASSATISVTFFILTPSRFRILRNQICPTKRADTSVHSSFLLLTTSSVPQPRCNCKDFSEKYRRKPPRKSGNYTKTSPAEKGLPSFLRVNGIRFTPPGRGDGTSPRRRRGGFGNPRPRGGRCAASRAG